MVLIKSGVEFKFAPGGMQILNALKSISKMIDHNLTITSGCDGKHSGPEDPHYRGDAYDVRSHDLDDIMKQQVLANLNNLLPRDRFFYFLESPNSPNEHFHIQVKKGTVYDIMDFFKS